VRHIVLVDEENLDAQCSRLLYLVGETLPRLSYKGLTVEVEEHVGEMLRIALHDCDQTPCKTTSPLRSERVGQLQEILVQRRPSRYCGRWVRLKIWRRPDHQLQIPEFVMTLKLCCQCCSARIEATDVQANGLPKLECLRRDLSADVDFGWLLEHCIRWHAV